MEVQRKNFIFNYQSLTTIEMVHPVIFDIFHVIVPFSDMTLHVSFQHFCYYTYPYFNNICQQHHGAPKNDLIPHQTYKQKNTPVKGRGQPKCFHNGIILIVICFKLVLQIY